MVESSTPAAEAVVAAPILKLCPANFFSGSPAPLTGKPHLFYKAGLGDWLPVRSEEEAPVLSLEDSGIPREPGQRRGLFS